MVIKHYGGGIFIIDLDTSKIPNLTLYSKCGSTGVAYGTHTTYDGLLYYRIAVAGALGKATGSGISTTKYTGAGGTSQTYASVSVSNGSNYAYSGSQTAGGTYTLSSSGGAQGRQR